MASSVGQTRPPRAHLRTLGYEVSITNGNSQPASLHRGTEIGRPGTKRYARGCGDLPETAYHLAAPSQEQAGSPLFEKPFHGFHDPRPRYSHALVAESSVIVTLPGRRDEMCGDSACEGNLLLVFLLACLLCRRTMMIMKLLHHGGLWLSLSGTSSSGVRQPSTLHVTPCRPGIRQVAVRREPCTEYLSKCLTSPQTLRETAKNDSPSLGRVGIVEVMVVTVLPPALGSTVSQRRSMGLIAKHSDRGRKQVKSRLQRFEGSEPSLRIGIV